jgi:hypothetical protein
VTGSLAPTGGRSTGDPETDNTGLSLVEVVMALALTLLVTGSLLDLVIPATALHRVLPEAAAVEQRLRYAFDRLFADLVTAGRGTTEYAAGRLGRFLPPIAPYRMGRRAAGDVHRHPVSDALSVLSVARRAGAETTILDPIAGAATSVRLSSGLGCVQPACGHRARDMVVVFNERGAWELFRVTGVAATRLILKRVHATGTAFEAGAVLAPVDFNHYYFDPERAQLRHYDGWEGDFPVVDQLVDLRIEFRGVMPGSIACQPAPAPVGQLVDIDLLQLGDGPWCGPSGLPFDADLLRIRAVTVTLRVQSAASELRGADPRLFARPGSAPGGRGSVPDHEVTFTVAPPNLQ